MKSVFKVFAFIALIAGFGMFQSCKKQKIGVRDVMKATISDIIIEIPEVPYDNGTYYGDTSMFVNLDSIIQVQIKEASALNIRSVKIDSCHLELLNGDASNNFSNFYSIDVTLRNVVSGSPTVAASMGTTPEMPSNTLDLPVNIKDDLKDHSLEYYTLSGRMRHETTKPLIVKGTFKYTFVVVH